MNDFETTLTSALQAKADRTTRTLETADAAHRLQARLDRVDRDRRRRTWATALTAAAAVLVAGSVYGITQIESSTSNEPAQAPHTTTTPRPYYRFTQFGEPGTYRLHIGRDTTGVSIGADLTFYVAGWQVGNYPVVSDKGGHYGGVAVYRPTALAAGTGCLGGKEITRIGQTRERLAEQLAHLPKSTGLQPPTAVQAFGQDAVHLRLRINPWCRGGVYRVAWTSRGGHGISYGESRHVVIDFWALDVRGVPVVVETWHEAGASSQLVDQITRTRDSITFDNGG